MGSAPSETRCDQQPDRKFGPIIYDLLDRRSTRSAGLQSRHPCVYRRTSYRVRGSSRPRLGDQNQRVSPQPPTASSENLCPATEALYEWQDLMGRDLAAFRWEIAKGVSRAAKLTARQSANRSGADAHFRRGSHHHRRACVIAPESLVQYRKLLPAGCRCRPQAKVRLLGSEREQ